MLYKLVYIYLLNVRQLHFMDLRRLLSKLINQIIKQTKIKCLNWSLFSYNVKIIDILSFGKKRILAIIHRNTFQKTNFKVIALNRDSQCWTINYSAIEIVIRELYLETYFSSSFIHSFLIPISNCFVPMALQFVNYYWIKFYDLNVYKGILLLHYMQSISLNNSNIL